MEQLNPKRKNSITRIFVKGYKSLRNLLSIDISPLTILAGSNNSGKSSIMQPVLLWKQTLEAPYDPGTLLINGPNVKFTAIDQLLSIASNHKRVSIFSIGMELNKSMSFEVVYKKLSQSRAIDIQKMIYKDRQITSRYVVGMSHQQILSAFPPPVRELYNEFSKELEDPFELKVVRDRCFLIAHAENLILPVFSPFGVIPQVVSSVIHLPGLRGNPEREYPYTAVGNVFPGTFEKYTASIIAKWQGANDDRLGKLNRQLEHLGLTSKVVAERINDTQVELRVGRLPCHSNSNNGDMVNIADVGVGLSQTLPILVALLTAQPEQLVYIEQPEIHLHPRAQSALAEILAEAANRGVKVVVETHSSLLLLGVQSIVAENKIDNDKVTLHWFSRDDNGVTTVSSTKLDRTGSFGDWPEDFADVELEAQSRFLDASEAQ